MCAPTPMTQSFPEDSGSAHRAGHLAKNDIIYPQTGSPSLRRARPGARSGMLGLAHASRQACRGQRWPPPPPPHLWPLQPPGEPRKTHSGELLRVAVKKKFDGTSDSWLLEEHPRGPPVAGVEEMLGVPVTTNTHSTPQGGQLFTT